MKKLLTIGAMSLLVASAFGQGVVVFGNRDTTATPAINAIVTDMAGNKIDGLAGFAAFLGGPAASTGYTVTSQSLIAGNLAQLGAAVNFRTGAAAGYVSPDTRIVPNVAVGQTAMLQMVAWMGNYSDWNSAFAAAQAGTDASLQLGASGTWTVTTTDPTSPVLNPNQGLTAFSLVPSPVPEPSTMALAGLGAAALLIFRRRK